MKKLTPLFLTLLTLLGLFTMLLSTQEVFKHLQLKQNPAIKTVTIGDQKITLSSKAFELPTYVKAKDTEDEIIKKYYLNAFPGVLNWAVFHCLGLSLGVVGVLFILFLMYNLTMKFEINFKAVHTLLAIALAIISFTVSIMYISSNSTASIVAGSDIMDHFNIIFTDPHSLTNTFVGAYLILGLIALLGITIVNLSVGKLTAFNPYNVAEIKKGFKSIKDSLNIFALFSSLLLGISIIGTRLQRDMIAEHFENGKKLIHLIYPDSFIYSYGMGFTLILALFFLPSLIYVNYSKKRMLPPEENAEKKTGWWNIGKESIDDIKLVFSIVLPLITSAVQGIL